MAEHQSLCFSALWGFSTLYNNHQFLSGTKINPNKSGQHTHFPYFKELILPTFATATGLQETQKVAIAQSVLQI